MKESGKGGATVGDSDTRVMMHRIVGGPLIKIDSAGGMAAAAFLARAQ